MWHALCSDYRFNNGELRVLRLLCEQIDVQTRAQTALKDGGLTYVDPKGVQRQRPEVTVEKQASRLISTLIKQLELPNDSPLRQAA